MEAREFKNGDVVYAQDGEVFSFDHAVGEWAYLYPSVLIQTTNYQGDDFEEHEEWAEHLVRRKLTTIAKKPWLQQIDADSRHLLSVRQSELDALSAKIGTARVELATAERALADREKALIAERSKLERRYQWVGDIKRMLGEEDSVFKTLSYPCISRSKTQTLRHNASGTSGGTSSHCRLRRRMRLMPKKLTHCPSRSKPLHGSGIRHRQNSTASCHPWRTNV